MPACSLHEILFSIEWVICVLFHIIKVERQVLLATFASTFSVILTVSFPSPGTGLTPFLGQKNDGHLMR